MLFVIASNYFAVLAPQVTGFVVNQVQMRLPNARPVVERERHDILVEWFIDALAPYQNDFFTIVALSSITILVLAIIRGVFMFFMRQTIIVMSRHIEYDQKNQVYKHYQELDINFFKTHSTGDMMNRITEDVSRVRMYTGPAIMYLINLVALIWFSVVNMLRKDPLLTLYVLAPLPVLAITIYVVNQIIHKRSEKIQSLLSDLTTNAQESFSGIRVIKSFVQEKAMFRFFNNNSENYKQNAVQLAKVEALYFPSMALMIGLSTLITIMVGGIQALNNPMKVGVIVEFVIYINMLTFPVSSIGWVASMIQRASASQKRINEFLETTPAIKNEATTQPPAIQGHLEFKDVSFTYPHTGIKALKNISLFVSPGEKVLILGKTGSGKSTIAQLLLRFYDPASGTITLDGKPLKDYPLHYLREQVSYVPQDVFLFSDTIHDNIGFGLHKPATHEEVIDAANNANILKEISLFAKKFDTMVGERGVTLSGGQKQRISIARALVKQPALVVLDDSLSAVDTATENTILNNLNTRLKDKTALIITHRIFRQIRFDKIVVMEDGVITEQGNHDDLIGKNGYYAQLYAMQGRQHEQH